MAHNLKRILFEEEGDDPTDSARAEHMSIQHYFLPQFSDVVPRLRKVVETTPDTIQRIRAAEALVLWGDSSGTPLAMLIQCLTSGTRREELLAAIQALGHIGPPAASAVQTLLQILSDSDDPEIRSSSMQALLLIRPEPDPAGFLVDSLMSNELDGNEAIRLLVGLGRPVVTQLVQKLTSERIGERFMAVKALSQIGWAPPEAITAILDSFKFDDCWNSILDRGRLFAPDRRMESFFWFDEPETSMQQAISHRDVDVRRLVTSMLASWYKPRSINLLSELTTAAHDSDDYVREHAVHSLFRLANGVSSLWVRVMPHLMQAVRDSTVHVRRRIFDSLYLMQDYPSGRKTLLAILAESDPDDRLRADADEELSAINRDIPTQVQMLVSKIEASTRLDEGSLQRLQKLGSAAVAAVPCLIARLDRETDSRSRSRLAFALAAISPRLAIIRDLLNDADSDVRYLTLAGLGSSGQPLDALRQLILVLRSDDDNSVRHKAATLLWSLDRDVEPYLTVLFSLLLKQPLYACKDRVLYNGASLNCLRDDCWPEVIDEILKLARSDASALALVAARLEDAERPNLHLLRLSWELFRSVSVVAEVASGLGGSFHENIASAELLLRMGPSASTAVSALRRQLGENYYLYRLHALQVLQQIGSAAELALGDVVQVLHRSTTSAAEVDVVGRDEVRAEAAKTIGYIVPELTAFVPALKLIADNEYVRSAVAKVATTESVEIVKSMLFAIAKRHGIAPAIPKTTAGEQHPAERAIDAEALVGILSDEKSAHRRGAALALGNLGPSAVVAIPHLIRRLREDQSTTVRGAAIVALGRFGVAAVAPLQALIQHADWIVRLEAAEALHRTAAVPEAELPSIIALVDDVDGNDPACYRRRLAPITFRRLLDQICELLNSRLSEFVLIDPQRRLLGPFSILIQARSWNFRDCAIINLGRMGRSAEPLVPLVLDALRDPDWLVRLAALRIIPKIATPTHEVIASLLRSSKDSIDTVQQEAISILQEWTLPMSE